MWAGNKGPDAFSRVKTSWGSLPLPKYPTNTLPPLKRLKKCSVEIISSGLPKPVKATVNKSRRNVNMPVQGSRVHNHLGNAVVHAGLAIVSIGFGLIYRFYVLGASLLESFEHTVVRWRGCWGGRSWGTHKRGYIVRQQKCPWQQKYMFCSITHLHFPR